MSHEYLFPKRQTRRDFLTLGAAAAAGAALPRISAAESAPVRIGTGQWTYTLDEKWGVLPPGMSYGFGCGIVVDSKDRVYVTSRSNNPCVAVFDAAGNLVETWSKQMGENIGYTPDQIKATAHCVYWSKEADGEFLYFTENVAKDAEGKPSLGKRVYKTDLKGKVLYTIGNVDREDGTHQKFTWTNPTDVAVAPNGDIYVVDGYGSQIVSRFDRNFKHLRTIGGRSTKKGPDAEHGLFNTCHGVWINTLKDTPEVYIADRANGRYEVFDLELNYKRTVSGDFVRNPCCFYQHGGHLYVPDLGSLVVILDKNDHCVARLGDGRGADKARFEKGNKDKFTTPHAMCVDSKGSLYILEWVPYGRVRKFTHTPA